MTFLDGQSTTEVLAHRPPTDDEVRRVAVHLINVGIDPAAPVSDEDRAWALDVAQALGLAPVQSSRYRDPVTRGWKKR